MNAILEFTKAVFCTHSFIYLNSVASFFRNLYLTGVLKNSFSTIIVVPTGNPISSTSIISPASAIILVPFSSAVLVSIVSSDIDAILASASPLNPIEYVCSKSSILLILLVACLSNDKGISFADIPFPLSTIFTRVFPPFFTSTTILVAPASIEFSTNSFTTFAGLSITSPAAILFIVKSSSNTIFPIFYLFLYLFLSGITISQSTK